MAADLLMGSDPMLADIVRRWVRAYQPERIYLFGFRAIGRSSEEADCDLLGVAPDGAMDVAALSQFYSLVGSDHV
jgi:hypothetical protein